MSEERGTYTVFKKATKHEAKLRMALIGPSGSGKTYTALNIAQHLGQRVALVDTERGSASKYGDIFNFDVLELETFEVERYIAAIQAAAQAGYDVLVIDSLSHAWIGKGGVLEFVDTVAKQSRSENTFAAWRKATPLHNSLVDTMLGAPMHLIVTMRSKMEYVQEKDDKGHTIIRKVGLQPVQRDGLEYEFDVVADMDTDNTLIVSKTRCPALNGWVKGKPGKETADVLSAWLSGAPKPNPEPLTESFTKSNTVQAVAPKLDRKGAMARLGQLQAKVFDLTGEFSAPHLKNHLLKHYNVDSVTKLSDEQLIAFGQHLRQLVVDAEAKLAANSAPAEDSHQADVAGAAEGV